MITENEIIMNGNIFHIMIKVMAKLSTQEQLRSKREENGRVLTACLVVMISL